MDILQKIIEACKNDKKSLTQLALKASEEVGELSQAVLSYTDAPACGHRLKTSTDILEEAVDVILCAVATAYKIHPDKDICDILNKIIDEKLEKWEYLNK